MNLVNLEKYIEKINSNKPLNWVAFQMALPAKFKGKSFFSIKHVYRNYYIITPHDASIITELTKLIDVPSKRVQAGLMGNTHKQKVSFAGLVSFSFDKNAYCVNVFNESGLLKEDHHITKKRIVCIENKELFYDKAVLPLLLRHHGISISNVDVVLGDGNAITNNYFSSLFDSLTHIYCLFDYDLGGLRTFNTLRTKHGSIVKFCTINNLGDNLQIFSKNKPSPLQFDKTLELCAKHNLNALYDAIRTTNAFCEQEQLLTLLEI